MVKSRHRGQSLQSCSVFFRQQADRNHGAFLSKTNRSVQINERCVSTHWFESFWYLRRVAPRLVGTRSLADYWTSCQAGNYLPVQPTSEQLPDPFADRGRQRVVDRDSWNGNRHVTGGGDRKKPGRHSLCQGSAYRLQRCGYGGSHQHFRAGPDVRPGGRRCDDGRPLHRTLLSVPARIRGGDFPKDHAIVAW